MSHTSPSVGGSLVPPAGIRLSDQVAEQLQALIMDDSFQVGERLPSERELGDLLRVSRTVIREAVRSLAAKGLVEVRRGGGTVVRAPDMRQASELMTMLLRGSGTTAFRRVHEVRTLLEVEIAGLAAERRADADLESIETRLAATLEFRADHERWAKADVAFHAAIAVATHNPLFPMLLNSMADMLTELRLEAAALPDTPVRAHEFHEKIAEAVKNQSRSAARRAMSAHMAEAEATYQTARLIRLQD